MYDEEVQKYMDSYLMTWKDVIQKHLKYKMPNLVNVEMKEAIDACNVPLYVYPTFMKSGKQYYCIKTQDSGRNMYVHSNLTKFRTEEIMPYVKPKKHKYNIRRFKKETSVFQRWKKDDDFTLQDAAAHDFSFWKVPRFVKKEEDLEDLKKVIRDNFFELKNMHIYNAANSTFPACSLLEFTKFSKKCEFADKNMSMAQIEREFIATNFEISKSDQAENPDRQLIRFEFIELLVRIANIKIMQKRKGITIAEAFKILLRENLSKAPEGAEWQGFRDQSLWTIEVNDVLEPNLENIKTIVRTCEHGGKKLMTAKEVSELFFKIKNLDLGPKEILYCLGMSKMTVARENTKAKYYE